MFTSLLSILILYYCRTYDNKANIFEIPIVNMNWKRTASKPEVRYERLHKDRRDQERLPKGYVPLIVGCEKEEERFFVHVNLLKEPSMVSLLEMAAQEFGYRQQGILRIPCDVQLFELIYNEICS